MSLVRSWEKTQRYISYFAEELTDNLKRTILNCVFSEWNRPDIFTVIVKHIPDFKIKNKEFVSDRNTHSIFTKGNITLMIVMLCQVLNIDSGVFWGILQVNVQYVKDHSFAVSPKFKHTVHSKTYIIVNNLCDKLNIPHNFVLHILNLSVCCIDDLVLVELETVGQHFK